MLLHFNTGNYIFPNAEGAVLWTTVEAVLFLANIFTGTYKIPTTGATVSKIAAHEASTHTKVLYLRRILRYFYFT